MEKEPAAPQLLGHLGCGLPKNQGVHLSVMLWSHAPLPLSPVYHSCSWAGPLFCPGVPPASCLAASTTPLTYHLSFPLESWLLERQRDHPESTVCVTLVCPPVKWGGLCNDLCRGQKISS